MMFGGVFLAICTAVSLVSFVAVEVVRRVAPRYHMMDAPNARSSHRVPVPHGGGLALVPVTVLAWTATSRLEPILSWRHLVAFIAGASIIAVTSFVDDLRDVPYPLRLLAQLTGALVFLAGTFSWRFVILPGVGSVDLGMLGLPISLLWIVGLTNAFNFMDGADGLAAGQAVVAGLGWAVLGLLTGHRGLLVLGAVLAAASFGFLLHNWQPARIFLGDVGSTFLGFSFAALGIIGGHDDPALAVAAALLVWPIIFDSGFTVVRRFRRGESVVVGHREFLFHRLMDSGWRPAAIARLYMLFPLAGAVLAFSWCLQHPILADAAFAACTLLCLLLWLLVRQQERRLPIDHAVARVVAAAGMNDALGEMDPVTLPG